MNNPKVQAIVAVLIIVTAVVLGLTKFKLPAKNVNLKFAQTGANQNSQLNSNSVNNASTVMNYTFPGRLPAEQIENKQVKITTPKGAIVFTLDAVQAPLAVSNFVYLANQGYFNGLTWHRVVPGFVIQGGDPLGTGYGGPGYAFADETVTGEYTTGAVAMANSGPNTNGSQFFIVLEDQPTLPKSYTIFGRVTSGMEAVKGIVQGDTMTTVTIEPAS